MEKLGLITTRFALSLWDNVDPNNVNIDPSNPNATQYVLLGNVIRIALFFAGILAVIFIVIGGFQYITSAGNPQNTAKAKSTITLAVIGLVVSLSAFAIVNLLIDNLVK